MASDRQDSIAAYALPTEGDAGGVSALGFVRDRELLVQRFVLSEVLAPPLALRGCGGATTRPAFRRDGKRAP